MNNDKAVSIKDVADFLGISTQMVHILLKNGKLKGFKVGSAIRILWSDLMEYVNDQKKEFYESNVEYVNDDDNSLVVNDLTAKIGGFYIRDISFKIPKGSIVSIIGSSGSGKTTLLKSIAGINAIEKGQVYFGRKRVDKLIPQERNFGYVFENYALFPNMNTRKNIIFPLKVKHVKQDEVEESLKKISKEIGISSDFFENKITELSEGMKQLVSLAREQIRRVDLILLDEPLSQVDKYIKDRMKVFFRRLIKKYGVTAVFSLNDPELAMSLSDYLVVMDNGRLVQVGNTADVYNDPVDGMVMEIMSNNGVNIIDVEVTDNYIESLKYKYDIEDGKYTFMFRPEDIEYAGNGINAKVISMNYYSSDKQLLLCELADGKEINLIAPAGQEGEITFIPTKPKFFRR